MDQEKIKIEQYINSLRQNAEKTGAIRYMPPESVIARATEYIKDKIPYICEALGGVLPPEALNAVIEDYALTFIGGYDFRATLPQMYTALKAIKPPQAFYIDRYGLYFGLYINYSRILEVAAQLVEGILRNDQKTPQDKEIDLISFYSQSPASHVMAAEWLLTNEIITVEDFAGIPTKTVTGFLSACEVMGNISRYVTLYYTTKQALAATPEELEAIPTPKLFKTHEQGVAFAELTADQVNEQMAGVAAKVGALLSAETNAEREQIKQEVKQTTEDITGASVNINNTLATILSRDIYAANNENAQFILPISRVIQDKLQNDGLLSRITPRTVEIAVDGLQMLLQFNRGVEVGNGRRMYDISLSEFANKAYGWDANQEEKEALLEALKLLNNLYIVLWKPNGNRTAAQISNIPQYDVDKKGRPNGNIRIEILPVLMKRQKPNLMTISDAIKARKLAKGQAQNHLRNQIQIKSQKEENALLDEVFGYQSMIDEAETPEEQASAREYIRKHKARDRREIIKLFDEQVREGLLVSYTRTENEKGEIIYRWRRPKRKKGDEQETTDKQ
ncbi:MAG: hypothetical protein IIW86_03955 [Clostridia bacterium]|nr:hypothetical protein [Clostridia bacterium]